MTALYLLYDQIFLQFHQKKETTIVLQHYDFNLPHITWTQFL